MTTFQIANLILYNFYFMQICHIFTPKALKLRKTKTCNYIHNDSQELLHHATRGKVIMYMHSAYVYLYVCIYIYTYTYRYKYIEITPREEVWTEVLVVYSVHASHWVDRTIHAQLSLDQGVARNFFGGGIYI